MKSDATTHSPRNPGALHLPAGAMLPMDREEMEALGWDQLDVLLVTGDAYVDHPSFGAALLGRWLVHHGFRTGIVAQPRWDSVADVARMGRPRLFAGVTAGALDSMLAHYTAFRKKRNDDAYTPGGAAGARPNRAAIVYTGLVRRAFPGLPVILGGIEASLRRATHYDFWSDRLRRSILLDSKADLLLYGMGERPLLEAARRIEDGRPLDDTLRGSACARSRDDAGGVDAERPEIRLPSHEEILAEPAKLMTATLAIERQVHEAAAWAVQPVMGRRVVFAPPAEPLTTRELDRLYALPFTREAHPSYRESIPAADMIRFSVTTHRGCAGGCSFCALALHQGRRIASRSARSVEAEVRALTAHPDWKGSVTDVGGPTANMWGARCALRRDAGEWACGRSSCLTPEICPHFREEQAELALLLQRIERIPGVEHLRVASGIRHDLALRSRPYTRALLERYVGGQLKLAPEHCDAQTLRLMRKPGFDRFEEFLSVFERDSRASGREQYVVPYLMSAFPGCTDHDMRELAAWLQRRGWKPRQVQCFIPTPGTVATAMFCAGVDTEGRPVHVARSDAARLRQHRILMPVEPTEKRAGRRGGPARPGPRPSSVSRRRSGGGKRRR